MLEIMYIPRPVTFYRLAACLALSLRMTSSPVAPYLLTFCTRDRSARGTIVYVPTPPSTRARFSGPGAASAAFLAAAARAALSGTTAWLAVTAVGS